MCREVPCALPPVSNLTPYTHSERNIKTENLTRIQSIELTQISSVIHALRSVSVHMHADLYNLIMCAALCNITTARIKVISPIITGPLWTPLQPLFNRYTHCPILTIVSKQIL